MIGPGLNPGIFLVFGAAAADAPAGAAAGAAVASVAAGAASGAVAAGAAGFAFALDAFAFVAAGAAGVAAGASAAAGAGVSVLSCLLTKGRLKCTSRTSYSSTPNTAPRVSRTGCKVAAQKAPFTITHSVNNAIIKLKVIYLINY